MTVSANYMPKLVVTISLLRAQAYGFASYCLIIGALAHSKAEILYSIENKVINLKNTFLDKISAH